MKKTWKLERGTIRRLNAYPKANLYYNEKTNEAWSRIKPTVYLDTSVKVVKNHCGIVTYNFANVFNLINYDIECKKVNR